MPHSFCLDSIQSAISPIAMLAAIATFRKIVETTRPPMANAAHELVFDIAFAGSLIE